MVSASPALQQSPQTTAAATATTRRVDVRDDKVLTTENRAKADIFLSEFLEISPTDTDKENLILTLPHLFRSGKLNMPKLCEDLKELFPDATFAEDKVRQAMKNMNSVATAPIAPPVDPASAQPLVAAATPAPAPQTQAESEAAAVPAPDESASSAAPAKSTRVVYPPVPPIEALSAGVTIQEEAKQEEETEVAKPDTFVHQPFTAIDATTTVGLKTKKGFQYVKLMYAIGIGDLEAVMSILNTAAKAGNPMDLNKALTIRECEYNASRNNDISHITPLRYAINRNAPAIVKVLLMHGANPSLQNKKRDSWYAIPPLYRAVHEGQWEVANLLLLHGADLDVPVDHKENAISLRAYIILNHQALEKKLQHFSRLRGEQAKVQQTQQQLDGSQKLLDLIFQKDHATNPDQQPTDALETLILTGDTDGLERFLEGQTSPVNQFQDQHQVTSTSPTADVEAYTNRLQQLYNKTYEEQSPVDITIPVHETPLSLAAKMGLNGCVTRLLTHANTTQPNTGAQQLMSQVTLSSQTAIDVAAERGHQRVLETFESYGADLTASNANGQTPLMIAAKAGQTDLVRWLINKGANPLTTDQQGLSSIAHAALNNHDDLACELATTYGFSQSSEGLTVPPFEIATLSPLQLFALSTTPEVAETHLKNQNRNKMTTSSTNLSRILFVTHQGQQPTTPEQTVNNTIYELAHEINNQLNNGEAISPLDVIQSLHRLCHQTVLTGRTSSPKKQMVYLLQTLCLTLYALITDSSHRRDTTLLAEQCETIQQELLEAFLKYSCHFNHLLPGDISSEDVTAFKQLRIKGSHFNTSSASNSVRSFNNQNLKALICLMALESFDFNQQSEPTSLKDKAMKAFRGSQSEAEALQQLCNQVADDLEKTHPELHTIIKGQLRQLFPETLPYEVQPPRAPADIPGGEAVAAPTSGEAPPSHNIEPVIARAIVTEDEKAQA